MKILIRNATIINPGQAHHLSRQDLRIENGLITAIADHLDATGADVWTGDNLHVSPGWLDIGASTMDPGFEHRETLNTFLQAAAAGGYTAVAPFPNTNPFIQSKSQILYLQRLNETQPVRIYPIGAISQYGKGEDLAEIYDMYHAGAVAFSDGNIPVQRSGLLLRALNYVKAFNGLVIDRPLDKSLAAGGQVHEGEVSTRLGMRGIPALAESSQVYRNVQLLKYAESRLLLHAISSEDSIPIIKAARRDGLQLFTSVPVLNLIFDHQSVLDYDTAFKVDPPLRSNSDRSALIQALRDNTIDAIISNHLPLEADQKNVEFPYAEFGAIALETTFALLTTYLLPVIDLPLLVEKICHHPRRIIGIPVPEIREGAKAELTLFDPKEQWTVTQTETKSLGTNNPLLGRTLIGRVKGVVKGQHVFRTSLDSN